MTAVDDVVTAVAAGRLVVVPTDTVYGVACDPVDEEAVRALSTLKRRSAEQPVAVVAAGADALLELVPELPRERLLRGPFTLVLPNPARRLAWLSGSRPDTIGIRLPELAGEAAELFARVGALAATSANLHGGADPRRVEEVPEELRREVAATLDVGPLPGTPSTVIDLTGTEPRVLREGAIPAAEALARVGE